MVKTKPRFSAKTSLKHAAAAFVSRKYDQAMALYNEILIAEPEHKEAKMGAILCDVAKDNEEQAHKLFEYYDIIKSQNTTEPEEVIITLVGILDKNTEHFAELVEDFEANKADDIDGILYSDIKKMAQNKGDFKRIFEDAMFSSRIIFTKKSEFYEFLNLLIDSGFSEVSMRYIENLSEDIKSDLEMQKIIKKALKINEN